MKIIGWPFKAPANRRHRVDRFHFRPRVTMLEERLMLSASSLVVAPAPSSVAVGNAPAISSNGDQTGQTNNGGAQTNSSSAPATSPAAGSSVSVPTGNAVVVAQLQAQPSVLGAVPGANGLTAPIPAVVAAFTAQTPAPIPGAAPVASLPGALTSHPQTITLTGGDVAQAQPEPPPDVSSMLSPSLPSVSSGLPNQMTAQTFQGSGSSQSSAASTYRSTVNAAAQEAIDPNLPLPAGPND